MAYTLTTTGTVGTITLEDLGGLVFTHPTTINLEDVASVASIVQSLTNGDLSVAVTAGGITVDTPTGGGPAPVVSKSYRSILRNWAGWFPSTENGYSVNTDYADVGLGTINGQVFGVINGFYPGTYDFETIFDLVVSTACTVTLGIFKRQSLVNVTDYALLSPGTLPEYAPTERVFTLPVGKQTIAFKRVLPNLLEGEEVNCHIKASVNGAVQIITVSANFTPVVNPLVYFPYFGHDI